MRSDATANEVPIERREGAASFLTLDRPEAMNAINPAMMRAPCSAIKELDEDDSVDMIVMTAAGEWGKKSGNGFYDYIPKDSRGAAR